MAKLNNQKPARKMKVLHSESTICFDVDDTLIIWDRHSLDLTNNELDGRVIIVDENDGKPSSHIVHTRHVEFLKKQSAKGHNIIVWSASGTKWAESVVRALGLEPFVDVVMAKPQRYVDDIKDAGHIIGQHVYLDIDGFSI